MRGLERSISRSWSQAPRWAVGAHLERSQEFSKQISCSSFLQHAKRRKRQRTQSQCDKWVTAAATQEIEQDVLASINLDYEEEGEFCMPGQVSVHQDSEKSTHISMVVKDYPGLLRVIAWVFNGLELVVRKSTMSTDDEGFANNSFWLTDRAGKPLTQRAADLAAERLGDFIVYCTPSDKAMQATFFEDGPITVDNDSHPEFTVVKVLVALEIEGALLKVTSALTNSGCSIQRGEVQTYQEKVINDSQEKGESFGEGERIFSFWVKSRDGKKLNWMRATSLLYTMGLAFGKSEGPLRAPSVFRA